MPAIEIIPVEGIGEVVPGDDLAGLLRDALARNGVTLRADDVLVVTQKIVSKAEDCFVALDAVEPGAEGLHLAAITRKDPRLVEPVLSESTAVLRAVPNVLIARHRIGLVMANAGIDRSNIGAGGGQRALLLPREPDASAARDAIGLPLLVIHADLPLLRADDVVALLDAAEANGVALAPDAPAAAPTRSRLPPGPLSGSPSARIASAAIMRWPGRRSRRWRAGVSPSTSTRRTISARRPRAAL